MKDKNQLLECQVSTSASSISISSLILPILQHVGISVLTAVIVSLIVPATGLSITEMPIWGNIGQYIKPVACIVCLLLLFFTIRHCVRKDKITWPSVFAISLLFVIALIAAVPFDDLFKLSNQNAALLSFVGIVAGVVGEYFTKSKKWGIIIVLSLAFCAVMVTIQMAYARVPNVVGKTVDEAETILLEKDIGIKLEHDEIINDTNREWIVTAQDPKKNSIHNKFFPVVLSVEDNNTDYEGVNWKAVPTLDRYNKVEDMSFEPIPKENNSLFGPNKEIYAEAGSFGEANTDKMTAYYKENEMAFVEIKPKPGVLGTKRWVYVPFESLDRSKREKITEIHGEMTFVYGKTNKDTFTYWEPKDESENPKNKCDRYELNKDTPVKVYFQENGFAFVQFTGIRKNEKTTDLVRLWVNKEDIDLVSKEE